MTIAARRRAAAICFALTAMLLAGCYSIPQHSPVTAAQARDQQLPDSVGFAPAPPKQGGNPAAIVAGFIAAGTGQAKNYAVARQFLAPNFAERWRPEQTVLVHSGGARLTATEENRISYSVTTTAQVNERGVYIQTSAEKRTLPYTVAKVDGQWRITDGPQGVVLGEDNFDRLFTPRALYFPGPDGRTYVPDLRWFRSGVTPTTLLRALAAGPTAVLNGKVVSNPLAATRSISSAAISTTVATVALSSKIGFTSARAKQAATQIGATLQGLRPLTVIRLVIDGELSATVGAPSPLNYDLGSTIALRGDAVAYLTGGLHTGALPLSRQLSSTRPSAITYLRSKNIAAAITTKGLALVNNSVTGILDARTNLLDPSIDRWGWIWSASPNDPYNPVVAASPKVKQALQVAFAYATSIQAIEVSPDGYRLLILYTTDDGPAAEVRGITRDAGGKPQAITVDSTPIPLRAVEGIDATWIDSESVAILTSSNGSDTITAQQIGGSTTNLGQISDAVAIAGGGTLTRLAVLLKNGDIATSQSTGIWTTAESNVAALGTSR